MSVASVESLEGLSSATCGEQSDPQPISRNDLLNKTEPRKKHQLQGGFECVFVEEPPKQFQTECAICLCVLKDPYLVDCCCNSFCQSCIKPIRDDNKPCPLCNVKFTTCIPDKRLQRTLNEMKVYCPHKELGCQWIGELIDLTQHLNVADTQLTEGCSFVLIECTFCQKDMQRKDLKEHKVTKCPQRPYSCDYCNDYDSTHEDVTDNHWPVCPSRPVPCPNQCGMYPEHKNLDDHLAQQCALAVINCPFDYAGCTHRFSRKDTEVHLNENLAHHMSLQAINHKQELEAYKSEVIRHKQQFDAYQDEVTQLKLQLETLMIEKQKVADQLTEERKQTHDYVNDVEAQLNLSIVELKEENRVLRQQIDKHVREITELKGHTSYRSFQDVKAEIASCKSDMIVLHTHLGLLPVEVTMREFETSKENKTTWFSSPFYTHSHGYKLCLVVYPNGKGDGSDTHVSIFIRLMQGEFDDELDWPFKGNISIQVLNQQARPAWRTVQPKLHVVHFTEALPESNRVMGQERADTGRGKTKFISHADLEHQYLKDDALIFRISNSN